MYNMFTAQMFLFFYILKHYVFSGEILKKLHREPCYVKMEIILMEKWIFQSLKTRKKKWFYYSSMQWCNGHTTWNEGVLHTLIFEIEDHDIIVCYMI